MLVCDLIGTITGGVSGLSKDGRVMSPVLTRLRGFRFLTTKYRVIDELGRTPDPKRFISNI